MMQLAQEIIEITKSNSKIVFKELPKDDPKTREPDIRKAVDILKWSPRISRQDGLVETAQYFERVLSI
jgi:nucleoside-diphosphate-sugar epimerase